MSLPPTWSMSTRVSTTTFVLEGFLNGPMGPCCKQYTRYFNIPVLTHWEEPNPIKLGETVFKNAYDDDDHTMKITLFRVFRPK